MFIFSNYIFITFSKLKIDNCLFFAALLKLSTSRANCLLLICVLSFTRQVTVTGREKKKKLLSEKISSTQHAVLEAGWPLFYLFYSPADLITMDY